MFVEDFLNSKPCCHNSIHDVTCSAEHHYREQKRDGGSDCSEGHRHGDSKKHLSDSWDTLEDSEVDSGLQQSRSTDSRFKHHHSAHKTIEHTV